MRREPTGSFDIHDVRRPLSERGLVPPSDGPTGAGAQGASAAAKGAARAKRSAGKRLVAGAAAAGSLVAAGVAMSLLRRRLLAAPALAKGVARWMRRRPRLVHRARRALGL